MLCTCKHVYDNADVYSVKLIYKSTEIVRRTEFRVHAKATVKSSASNGSARSAKLYVSIRVLHSVHGKPIPQLAVIFILTLRSPRNVKITNAYVHILIACKAIFACGKIFFIVPIKRYVRAYLRKCRFGIKRMQCIRIVARNIFPTFQKHAISVRAPLKCKLTFKQSIIESAVTDFFHRNRQRVVEIPYKLNRKRISFIRHKRIAYTDITVAHPVAREKFIRSERFSTVKIISVRGN